MTQILSIRIKRTKAGRVFPFDRVNLVRHDDRAIIEKMYRYAIVMPVDQVLKAMLMKVDPGSKLFRPHRRNEAISKKEKLSLSVWATLLESTDWIMVIPILGKWGSAATPRYLTAETWYNARNAKNPLRFSVKTTAVQPKEPFNHQAYLQTPTKIFRPICVACPRLIEHVNGNCHVGDKICYTSLVIDDKNHFKEGEQLETDE